MRLDPWHIDFVQQEVVISLASQDGDGRPSIARAAGCRPSADGRALRLIVPEPASRRFLADIEATGRVAAVFSRPTTFHTIQVKGRDARRVSPAASDSECAEAFLAALARELTRVGDPPSLVEARLGFDAASLAAIEFTIDALFLQTPGPAAGERLKPPT